MEGWKSMLMVSQVNLAVPRPITRRLGDVQDMVFNLKT